jgi:hypothetical protein
VEDERDAVAIGHGAEDGGADAAQAEGEAEKEAGHRPDFAGDEFLRTHLPRCRDNRPLKAVKFHTISSEVNFRKTHARILARNGFPDNVGLSSGAKVLENVCSAQQGAAVYPGVSTLCKV